jgi:hypothetical protein
MVRHEEAAVALLAGERVEKVRRIKQRHFAQDEPALIRFGAIAGNDVEFGPLHDPPRTAPLGDFAVGDPAVIEDVLGADSLRPLAFGVIRAGAAQDAFAHHSARRRFHTHIEERAVFGLAIVLHVIAPDLLVFIEAVEIDVAGGV